MEDDPIRNDKRRASRQRTFGDGNACAFCGCTDADVLERMEPAIFLQLVEKAQGGESIVLCKTHSNMVGGRTVIEQHHPGVKKRAPELTIPLCGVHHASETERQRAAGLLIQSPRSSLERFVLMFKAFAQFLQSWSEMFLQWAEWLLTLIAALDKNYPGWTKLDEAK